jgi:RNA polymerase sigma-70 factor (ECF subfamily)
MCSPGAPPVLWQSGPARVRRASSADSPDRASGRLWKGVIAIALTSRPRADPADVAAPVERPAEPASPAAIRQLDAVALGAAFEQEAPVLLAAARAITFDAIEAEDLVQTTFELALRNVHQLRDPSSLRSWLLTIQTREAFRLVRRLRRSFGLRGAVIELPVAHVSAADSLAIRDALRRLPPRMRAAIVLHHMAGLTVPQVARALDRSENTIRSQLRIGLQRLRAALRDD